MKLRWLVWLYLFIAAYDFWLATIAKQVWSMGIDVAGGLIWLAVFVLFLVKLRGKKGPEETEQK